MVLDNLSTHFRQYFDHVFGKCAANKLLRRGQLHYTPKQASWLKMAEIEILSHQGRDRRVEGRNRLQCEVMPGSRSATLHCEPSIGRSSVRAKIRSSFDIAFRNFRVNLLLHR